MTAPVIASILLTSVMVAGCAAGQAAPGYDDTPHLPDSKWRVHDKQRPHPPVVEPPPASSQRVEAPGDAVVLFDGTDLSEWKGGDGAAAWKLADGAMEVNGTGNIRTVREFGDCQIHLEWAAPAEVEGESQGRGNSGVFLMGRYEVQVLDSFDNVTYADGQAAALYGQRPPDVNASRPPGEWQTFDLFFRAPRFEGGELVRPAFVTVVHNGVVVHNHVAFLGATTHRAVAQYQPHGEVGPIVLQDHQNPVRFRNIWVRPLRSDDGP